MWIFDWALLAFASLKEKLNRKKQINSDCQLDKERILNERLRLLEAAILENKHAINQLEKLFKELNSGFELMETDIENERLIREIQDRGLQAELDANRNHTDDIRSILNKLREDRYFTFEFRLPVYEAIFRKNESGRIRLISIESKDEKKKRSQ